MSDESNIMLSPEAFEKVVELIENPPAPTPTLVELMRRARAPLLSAEFEFVMRVLRLTSLFNEDGSDGVGHEDVFWRTDGKYAPVTFFVQCNDVFAWATADAVDLTPQNIRIFEQSICDCKASVQFGEIYGPMLFCARVSGMWPQGAAYPHERELWPLFDACGPERAIDYSNPSDKAQVTPHLLTMSGANRVRLEIHAGSSACWVEGPPEQALGNAWCILDSAKKAFLKAEKSVPSELTAALEALSKWALPVVG